MKPDIASLRSRREGVNRGLWWGEEGVPASLPARRFHLIGVGLPKTGTTSLAYLFQPFRWGDEFLLAESIVRLIAWKGWQARPRRYAPLAGLTGRSRCAGAGLRQLQPLFPGHPGRTAPRSPLRLHPPRCRLLGRLLSEHGVAVMARHHRGQRWPEWQVALGRLMAPSFDPGHLASPEHLRLALRPLAEELLGFYARETARIEAALPPERSLVIPTDSLSRHLDTLAAFAGVPRSALNTAGSHANRGHGKIPLVAALPDLPHLLEQNGLGAAYALPGSG